MQANRVSIRRIEACGPVGSIQGRTNRRLYALFSPTHSGLIFDWDRTIPLKNRVPGFQGLPLESFFAETHIISGMSLPRTLVLPRFNGPFRIDRLSAFRKLPG